MDTHPLSIALQMLPTGRLAVKPPVSRNLPQLLHASSIPVVNYLPDFAASTTLPQRPTFTRVTGPSPSKQEPKMARPETGCPTS